MHGDLGSWNNNYERNAIVTLSNTTNCLKKKDSMTVELEISTNKGLK